LRLKEREGRGGKSQENSPEKEPTGGVFSRGKRKEHRRFEKCTTRGKKKTVNIFFFSQGKSSFFKEKQHEKKKKGR